MGRTYAGILGTLACLVASTSAAAVRTLFDGFKRANGVGPLAWLRAERLERARAELVSARRGEVRITDVAMRWGFQHLGRFCVAYQARFGETPTATLRGDH
jgi:AraC-like DNA-binding protein